jgi:hypothetical protein
MFFWGSSKNIFFRACRASVEIRKTRIPAKGFARPEIAGTGTLANRIARMAWAIMVRGERYKEPKLLLAALAMLTWAHRLSMPGL